MIRRFGQTREIVDTGLIMLPKRQYGVWLVLELNTERLIGFGGYWPFHAPEPVELFYGLAQSVWGRDPNSLL
ncbi:MAG: hypothetical protein AAF633_22080 [Chloroflexota bacterium]